MQILFQFAIFDYNSSIGNEEKELASFSPSQPREKWQRKTTFIKIKVILSFWLYLYNLYVKYYIIRVLIFIIYRILLQAIGLMM